MKMVLIPIKSKYTAGIYAETKKWEYRKWQRPERIHGYNDFFFALYETSPVSKITGIVQVIDHLEGWHEDLWDQTKEFAGISHLDLVRYYWRTITAHAYRLHNPMLITPISPKEINAPVPRKYIFLTDAQSKLVTSKIIDPIAFNRVSFL